MATNPPNPALDYSAHYNTGLAVIILLLAIIATACVGLRFISKRLLRASPTPDDYLAVLALLFHHGLFISSAVSLTRGGLGRDINVLQKEDPAAIPIMFKSLFALEITYGLSCSTVKLSVLAFYYRLFPTKTVNMGVYILGAASVAWAIAVEIVTLVQCRPLRAFWDVKLQQLPETKCLDVVVFFLANSSINSVIDLAILALPIHEIIKLQTSRKNRFGIASVFLLGSIAFAASLARTISKGYMLREGATNFTKQAAPSVTTTVIEVYVAIVGACLPTLVPIYRQLRYGYPLKSLPSTATGNSSGYGYQGGGDKSGGGGDGAKTSSTRGQGDASSDDLVMKEIEVGVDNALSGTTGTATRTEIGLGMGIGRKIKITSTSATMASTDGADSVDLPMQGIMVRSDVRQWSDGGTSKVY